jgi:hypothetical protein
VIPSKNSAGFPVFFLCGHSGFKQNGIRIPGLTLEEFSFIRFGNFNEKKSTIQISGL